MSQFYNEVYQNYYNKLSSSKNTNKVKYLSEESVNRLKSLKGQIASSTWKELAVEKLKDGVITNLENDTKVLDSNISNSLVKARDMSYNELLPKLAKLKNKDSEYEALLKKINTASGAEKASLEIQRVSMEKTLASYKNDVDSTIRNIKSLNDGVNSSAGSKRPIYMINKKRLMFEKDEDGKLVQMDKASKVTSSLKDTKKNTPPSKSATGATAVTTYAKNKNKTKTTTVKTDNNKPATNNTNNNKKTTTSTQSSGKTKRLETLGATWKIVDTKLSVKDYSQTVLKNKICQTNDTSKYSDYCLAFSYVHASNMKNGNVDNAAAAGKYAHSGEFKTFVTESKSELMSKIYSEVNKGNPVILQVNGNSKGTVRHFVTVVGYKDNITDPSKLTEKDLLILDSWDGCLERMDTKTSRFLTTGKSCGKKDYSGYRLQVMK